MKKRDRRKRTRKREAATIAKVNGLPPVMDPPEDWRADQPEDIRVIQELDRIAGYKRD
jgi:hypothetical protein